MKIKTQPCILVLCIIFSQLLSLIQADAEFAWYCHISDNAVAQLEYVSNSNSETSQNDLLLDDQGGALRRQLPALHSTLPFPALRREQVGDGKAIFHDNPSTEPPSNSTLPEDNNNKAMIQIQVRQCFCASYISEEYTAMVFCPLSFSHCAIPEDSTEGPVCINMARQDTVRKRVFPLLLISLFLSLVTLLSTRRGWHAINYLRIKLRPSRQEEVIRRLLQANPYLARGHIQQYLQDHGLGNDYIVRVRLRRETPASSADTLPPPNQLSLKTRIYERSNTLREKCSEDSTTSSDENDDDDVERPSDNLDDDHDPSCTICFAALETGDRVGALHCRHIFHVSCLKDWLACRNVCPLCLKENIATPSHVVRTTTAVSSSIDHDNNDPPQIMEHDEDPLQAPQ
jgi:hypothetical protein